MARISLHDGPAPFDVSVLEAPSPARVVLFAVGGGGDPERHLPLLEALVARGCTVVAPHFERFTSPFPTEAQLQLRARRLRLALDVVARPELPAVGVGHSIGATMLLALAGGQIWLGPGQPLAVSPDARVTRLVLLAPATGQFQAPGALDAVHLPIQVWAGTRDGLTPPAQAELLARALGPRVDLRVIEGAGHFSFMDVPPPQTTEPLPDRPAFLAGLARELGDFVTR